MHPTVKRILLVVVALVVLTPFILFYGMKISPLSWQLLGPVNESSGLAIKGYDPVAYFHDDSAKKGHQNKGLRVNDSIIYFSSDENKLMFKTFPERFLPQYGGYCATAVSSGLTADINPEIWHIEAGKLYLFFDESARDDFIARIDQGIIDTADIEWSQR